MHVSTVRLGWKLSWWRFLGDDEDHGELLLTLIY